MTTPQTDHAGLPVIIPEEVGMSAKRLMRISPAMQKFVDQGSVAGMVTLVARHGRVVHYERHGYSNYADKTPMPLNAIFRLHSQSKPVAAVAVMSLYEEGHFLLDDPIADYLPEFSEMQVWTDEGLVNATNPITIRQLLTHTAGIGHYIPFPDKPEDHLTDAFKEAGLDQVSARAAGLSLKDFVKKLASLPLCAQPGTVWRYSLAMEVLGRLVEVVSGQNYRDFVTSRIFKPLGMPDTDFYVPAEKMHRLPGLYLPGDNGELRLAEAQESGNFDYSQLPTLYSASGGLVSTAPDYLRFAQMLLNGGELGGVSILSPTSVNLMMSNHLGATFGDKPLVSIGLPWVTGYGMGHGFCGLVITDAIASGTAGSDGEYSWGGAASTDFWIDRQQGIIGMIFAQLLPSGIQPTRARMHQMTYQAVSYYEQ